MTIIDVSCRECGMLRLGSHLQYNRFVVRYENQPLPDRPRIAVIANDALGNFVMATPVLQLLRAERKPSCLDFFGGMRTIELQEASDLIDTSFVLHGAKTPEIREMLSLSGRYDLILNLESTSLAKTMAGLLAGAETFVCGPCIAPGGRGDLAYADDDRGRLWMDRKWVREELAQQYSFLRSAFIPEIFSRLAYLEGDLPSYRVAREEPPEAIPDVLIATAASLPEKLWPIEHWLTVLRDLLAKGLSVGLVGAAPRLQSALWKGAEEEEVLIGDGMAVDLRGQFSLPQVVGALGKARAVLSLDNGILHLAVAAGTPTVGLFRHGIHRLWAPPSALLDVLTPGDGKPVSEIMPESALKALERRLG